MRKLLYLLICLILAACGSQKSADISSDSSKVTSSSIKMSAQSITAQMETGKYRQGEVLVKFKSGVEKASSQKVHQAVGASVIKSYTLVRNLEYIRLPKGLSVKDAINQYMSDPNVEYAEPNYIMHITSIIPNDTFFRDQWALLNTGQYAYGTAGADIKATAAWEVSIGSPAIIVAVLDTGIDYNHSELVWNVWRNLGETNCLDGIDNDNNGYIDDCIGWDATTCAHFSESGSCTAIKLPGNDPMDDYGHGTHVAGIIGAKGNNSAGIAGIMWMANMMAIKVLNADGEGSWADIASGIQYAVVNHAKVINASLGGSEYSNTLYDAIAAANTAGVLLVAAAGNEGVNNDLTPHYPSSYDLPNIIAVAATDQDDRRVPFSNFGPLTVDVAAPGTYVLSTIPLNLYSDKEFNSGTSMATPHVTGLAGLLSAYYSHFTHSQIRTMILRYIDVLPTLNGWILTGGRINAEKALKSLWATYDLTATPVSSLQIDLAWTDRATDEIGHRIYRSMDGTTYVPIATVGVNGSFYSDSGLTDGTKYYYRVRTYNDIGESPVQQGTQATAITPLNPPTNLRVVSTSSTQIQLAWSDNSSTEQSYLIERRTLNTDFVQVGQVGQNTSTFPDTGLNTATKYWYRVKAYNPVAGFSVYSNEISATTLTASGGHKSGGGGGCSIGARQNAPTAFADAAIMLLPLLVIAALRRRR